ncbi:MAG: Jag N-terminal domain-containing protein [Oscillospiraceae bacterium]|nr:Jag N-terminal domain-containing protein [Oscillospiraceae bacterium]
MIKEEIGTGATVEEAKASALVKLGISEYDDFTVEVLQNPTKKILGLFGGSPAKVKISVHVPDKKSEKKHGQDNKKPQKNEKKQEKKPENKKVTPQKAEKVQEKAPEKVELPLEKTNNYSETAEYIKSMVLALGMESCEVTEMSNEEEIYFELECGDDYGIIIGKRGETLDALQYLARMSANKGRQSYKRVSINVGNYRAKREDTLKSLAHKTAIRAVKQGRSISLEPMNPYERRVIHTAVQDIEGATSHSIGSDLDRRVVIAPIDGGRGNGGRKGSYNRDRGGRRERKEPYKPEISPDRTPKSDMDGFLYGPIDFTTPNTSDNNE